MNLEQITWRTGALALMVSLFWGANTVALKLGLEAFPPAYSALWRMATGAAVVVAWALSQGITLRPRREEMGPLTVLAALFVVQILALNFGTNWTSPGYAVILINTHPLFTNVVSHFVLPEDRLTPMRAAGLALAFAGVAWLVVGRPEARLASQPVPGNMLVAGSAALLAVRVVYTQRLVRTIDPIMPVVWQMLLSLPAFLLVGLIFEPLTVGAVTWKPIAAIFYQGAIVAGLCFVIWTRLLKKHPAGALSVFAFTVPIFGVVISAIIFNEAITDRLIASIGLVMAGIIVVTRKERTPQMSPIPRELIS
jgi:drug/metabolite transporter (DMT)-like permease